MNLLILTNNPDRASFRQRIGAYCDILRRNGIRCEVAKLPSGFLARRRLFKRASDFDGVFLHKKKLNFLDAFWLRRYSKKLIYNFDDAIMYSDKTPERDSRSHFQPWRRSVRLADMVIAGSSYLAEHARRFNSNVEVLPIGLKVSDYKVDNPARIDDKIRLVWIGSKSTLGYLEEIRPALEEIGTRFDNVVLRMVCDDFLELKNMPVEKHKWSVDTRGIDLATSDIGLAPLPDNRFTRGKCSFKVLEYSAAGLPVVAAPVGTNSEYLQDNITGFLARDADEWIDKLCRLIEDPILRQRMGKAGMELAREYDVDLVGQKLTALIAGCLAHNGRKLYER
jgi:glycosyltransferase involved in cell wall biosynthesis